jgi:hypothetical protein
MEQSFGRRGEGLFYMAELSFDAGIFEPGAGADLSAEAFSLRAIGFDQEDAEHIEAMGYDVASWEKVAIEGLSGFRALDAWVEEAATDEQSAWLEESGYLDEIIDMEADFKTRFAPASIIRAHA